MNQPRPIDLVDGFFGVDSPGNCLVGPYLPFGLVRPGPDTLYPDHDTTGYRPGRPIIRFSQTHVAGTGGTARYGNIGITPFSDEPARFDSFPFLAPKAAQVRQIPVEEESRIGYYGVTLPVAGIRCEITCGERSAFYRIRFPEDGGSLLIDAGSVVRQGFCPPGEVLTTTGWDSDPRSIGGQIEILSDRELLGRSDLRGGWGHDKPYSIFFYITTDSDFEPVELLNRSGMVPAGVSRIVAGPDCRARIRFNRVRTLSLRIGISFVSCAKARASIERETAGRSFEEVRAEAETRWSSLLGHFRLSGGSEEQRRIFYSCLHRISCMPTDLGTDDENPFWHSGLRHFTDFYCLWDSVRNANSFHHLFFPSLSSDICNALLDIAEHSGWLPDAHIAGHAAFMQSACAADIVLTEALAKSVPGLDPRRILKWVRKNAEAPSPDPLTVGRFRDEYERLGYVASDKTIHPVSRHIEYTYHDWCISRAASLCGDKTAESEFRKRADRLWNLWDDRTKAFVPKSSAGKTPSGYDPWTSADPDVYEGTVIMWAINGLHDIPGLIRRIGGDEAFVAFLDRLFDEGHFAVKETRMHAPHLYTYAGRPDRTADRIRESIRSHFRIGPRGLDDNEDMGCQSGYFLWNSLGLYPVYGQTHYILVPPLFDSFEADLENGKTIRITADRSGGSKYISAAELNGKQLDRAWVRHEEIANGAELKFILSDKISDWGTKDRPRLT